MKAFLKDKIKNPVAVCLIATLCCALWGSAFPVIKIGYGLLNISSGDYASQILFAGVRFALAGLFTIIMGSVLQHKLLLIKPRGYYKIGLLALFQTVLQYLFFYIGLAHTTGTKGSVINSTSVFFCVLIASLILRQEKLSAKKLFACVIGFAGVVIINMSGGGLNADFSMLGEGFILLSALSYAMSSVLIKAYSKSENPVSLSGYQFMLGGVFMAFAGFIMGGRLELNSIKALMVLLYLAMLSAVAYTLWGVLLKYNEVSRVTVFGFMTPVFGCLLSALFLKESMAGNGVYTVISLVLVCTGIIIINMNNSKLGDKL